MSTCVCVLSNSGKRLMPTFRLGKVRHLLKDGKAKIVKHHPFTIQLLYDGKTNTQPIEICEDVGYNYIGISVKNENQIVNLPHRLPILGGHFLLPSCANCV